MVENGFNCHKIKFYVQKRWDTHTRFTTQSIARIQYIQKYLCKIAFCATCICAFGNDNSVVGFVVFFSFSCFKIILCTFTASIDGV